MTLSFQYSAPHSDNVQQLIATLSQCFITTHDLGQIYFNRIGIDNFRILRQNSTVVGGLALLPMQQWWGGQRVPMTGIASVGIAPEHRGTGAAFVLMQETLRELYAADVPLSALYPATQRLYRKVGYEQAGSYTKWSISAAAIQIIDRTLPLHPIVPINFEAFHNLQQRYAQHHNGHLDRHAAIWQDLLSPEANVSMYGYGIGSTEQPEGYVILSQQRLQDKSVLYVHDRAILSAQAGRSLWSFLADHRSQVDEIQWRGAIIDPLMLLLPEQPAKLKTTMQWLLRIIHVPSALEKRGYPKPLNTELHLAVQDDILPENSGNFILSVSNGTGKVTSGGTGDLAIGIRGLATLYSGFFTPRQLHLAGFLEASDTVLDIATQIFAGSPPWLPDFF